jgi:hypothetical protein
MKLKIYLIILLFLFSVQLFAQKYIEPILGIQYNQKTADAVEINIKQITLGAQICFAIRKYYENGFQINVGLPIPFKSYDSSFSLNPGLPFYNRVDKSLSIFSSTVNFFQNFKLISFTEKDKLFFQLNIGFTYQKLSVDYTYDKTNYVILNPDKDLQKAGLYIGIGLQYLHELKNGRIFLQGSVNSPPLVKRNDYPTIYKGLLNPVIAAGYSIKL